jgi:hypothetical protein
MSLNRPLQIPLLVLAVLPCFVVAVSSRCGYGCNGETPTLDWHSSIWPVVALQVAAIIAFSVHAASNNRLAGNEVAERVLEFVVFIPFGMLSYWNKHVWDQPPGR